MTWGGDPPELTEARMMVGLSDVMGKPGLDAVRSWEPDTLAAALLVVVASDGVARYEERRRIAEGSL